MAEPFPPLPPGSTIGILGGGQLGRMLAMAAARLGYRTHVYSPEPDPPAGHVATRTTIAGFDDAEALATFGRSIDVATFEFENVALDGFAALAAAAPIRPAPAVLAVAQDRAREKSFLNRIGVATAPWAPIAHREEAEATVAEVGFPCVLKTARWGYDGKGQAVLHGPEDLAPALDRLAAGRALPPLIVEAFVPFVREVSVLIARDARGNTASFDVVENRHKGGILDLSIAPARIAPETAAAARAAALRVAEAFDLVGLLCLELFVLADGSVLANEIAPRPHNSGHWTIEACAVSQFEQQVRAIAGLPLGDPSRHSDALMRNLIGEAILAFPRLLATPGLIPHHYGKGEVRAGRKMGHVTRLFPLGGLPDEAGIAAAFPDFAP
ncbi:5-(carboxyamino)imidazole ribonucleotide synthase [Elioraea thermophila]|uniref:5-(carboxyamino)imidazole ribonucleotide synthase n=1 Tax=Elioraea thermophila TaxID=2185104 RepID=UPI000DF2FA56|nr:5-(carboxyamino)imidazole ribonucleotide synthase [Elioraea thermophila]